MVESNCSLWLQSNGCLADAGEWGKNNKLTRKIIYLHHIDHWNTDVRGQLTHRSHFELSFTEFDLWPGSPLSVTPPPQLVAPLPAAEEPSGPPPVACSAPDTSDTVGSAAPPRCLGVGLVLREQQSWRTTEPPFRTSKLLKQSWGARLHHHGAAEPHFLTMFFLIQNAKDRVISSSSLDILQNLVHAGGLGAAGQNHPVLVLRTDHSAKEMTRRI